MNPDGSDDGVLVLPIRTDVDVMRVRRAVAGAMNEIGASAVQRIRMVTAASELARNVLRHGGGGEARISTPGLAGNRQVELVFIDRGPGIREIARALADGFSTAGGLGLGLGGARRLCSEFEIRSTPGEGTWVRVRSWTGRR